MISAPRCGVDKKLSAPHCDAYKNLFVAKCGAEKILSAPQCGADKILSISCPHPQCGADKHFLLIYHNKINEKSHWKKTYWRFYKHFKSSSAEVANNICAFKKAGDWKMNKDMTTPWHSGYQFYNSFSCNQYSKLWSKNYWKGEETIIISVTIMPVTFLIRDVRTRYWWWHQYCFYTALPTHQELGPQWWWWQ